MSTLAPLTLWSNLDRTRFFLVPDEQQFSPGGFTLHTLTGRKLTVDERAVAEFEISQDEAKKWLKDQFGNILDTTRDAIDRFIERLSKP